jgi:hypothetical protein
MDPTELLLARINELKEMLSEIKSELKSDHAALTAKVSTLESRVMHLELEAAKFQGSTKIVVGIISILGLSGIGAIANAMGVFK